MNASQGEKKQWVVVDRWEGDFAVLEAEGGGIFNLPRWCLPGGVSEGDILEISIKRDTDARELRTERVKDLQKRLRKRKSDR